MIADGCRLDAAAAHLRALGRWGSRAAAADVVVFANQRFTDGDREADFIVLRPSYGIAVIEVKGGLIHLIDGQWRQPWSSDPRGWKPINPVEQALKGKYALRGSHNGPLFKAAYTAAGAIQVCTLALKEGGG